MIRCSQEPHVAACTAQCNHHDVVGIIVVPSPESSTVVVQLDKVTNATVVFEVVKVNNDSLAFIRVATALGM